MDDKVKAIIEQDKIDVIEVKARSVYEVRNQQTSYGVYVKPQNSKSDRPAIWVADVATKDDADFVCKCLQARYK